MPDDLTQIKADIVDAFNAAVAASYSLGGDETANVVDARDRVLAHVEALSSPEGLIAELRKAMAGMKPESRLDVIDSLCAGYCVQCGDAVKDMCGCTNEE